MSDANSNLPTEPFKGTRTTDIMFCAGGKKILLLTEQGMIYKDVLIEDAGEAYKAFMEALQLIKSSSTY